MSRGHIAEGQARIPARLRERSPLFSPVPPPEGPGRLVTTALGDDGVLIDALAEHVDGLVVAAFGVGHVPAGTVTSFGTLAARTGQAQVPLTSVAGSSWGRSPRWLAVGGGALCLAEVAVSRSRSRVDQKASAQPAEATPILGTDGAIDTLEGNL